MKAVILLHVVSTLLMVGIIWFIQIVHYPLFNRIGGDVFMAYEAAHTTLVTWVVMPLMLVELVTALLLAVQPISGISPIVFWLGLILVTAIWLSTLFLQVPQHSRLSLGFDETAYRALVTSNWIRTIAWSLRGLLVIFILAKLLDVAS